MDPIAMQKQLRDNSEDLSRYIGDLKNWQDEIKQKEENLKSGEKDSKVCQHVWIAAGELYCITNFVI